MTKQLASYLMTLFNERYLPWQPHIAQISSLKNGKLIPKIVSCRRNQNNVLERFEKGIIVPKVTILRIAQPDVYLFM